MSLSGKFTSLELNFLSLAPLNQGFRLNPTAAAYHGSWNPGAYTQGTVSSSTVLDKLTAALPLFLSNCVPAKLSAPNYRLLFQIGSGSCPALGNSRPDTFLPTYAGWGTWQAASVDAYGNVSGSGPQTLTVGEYPPKEYGSSSTYSYIWQNTGNYAWLTGWPGRNSWQEATDDFAAAYQPIPSEPAVTDYDTYFSRGFLATVAQQAYYEFWSDYLTRRPNQYMEFVRTWQQCWQYSGVQNRPVSSYVNSSTFLRGNYSGINDLTTSDISGVNLAFKDFGSDLINLGKAIDLAYIHQFGLPSRLLLTLNSLGALTEALKFALLYVDLTAPELAELLVPTYVPTPEQEKKIYSAYQYIAGEDLENILIIVNCATAGLSNLADLLNPQKFLPSSYQTLTVPVYTTTGTSAKAYSLVYVGGGVNPDIYNWGTYLTGILPDDITKACGAFMASMCQIKNINMMEFQKFSQVVQNLEVTDKDLPLISTAGVPGNQAATASALERSAFGSGNGGTWRFCDFFGAMAGIPYNSWYEPSTVLLNSLSTPGLSAIYTKLYQKSLGNDWALLSAGTGVSAQTLYRATVASSTGVAVVQATPGVDTVLAPGATVAFSSGSSLATPVAPTYTVLSVTSTSITLTSTLTSPVAEGDYIYVYDVDYNTTVPDLAAAANAAISAACVANPDAATKLNWYWRQIGRQLTIEQRSLPLAVKRSEAVYTDVDPVEFQSFVQSITQYALDKTPGGTSDVLEAIADTTTVAGQSLVGASRESRNAYLLANAGGTLDSDVADAVEPNLPSAYPVVTGGAITSVVVTNPGSGYGIGCDCCTPGVVVWPQGDIFGGSGSGAKLRAVMDENTGSITSIAVDDPGSGYSSTNLPPIYIDPPPRPTRLGGPVAAASFAGSPYTGQDPVPDTLVTGPGASLSRQEILQQFGQP